MGVRKSRGVCNDIVGCLMHGVGREALDEDLCLENIDVEASVLYVYYYRTYEKAVSGGGREGKRRTCAKVLFITAGPI